MNKRENIFAYNDKRRQQVTFCGEQLYVVELSAEDHIQLQDLKASENKSDAFIGYMMLVRSLHDEDGSRIFTDEDLPKLMKKGTSTLGEVMNAVVSINSLGEKKV